MGGEGGQGSDADGGGEVMGVVWEGGELCRGCGVGRTMRRRHGRGAGMCGVGLG